MKNIIIYSNCHGKNISQMFKTHPKTKNIFNVYTLLNYTNLTKQCISDKDLKLLKICDIFIYQTLNKTYDYSEYNISNILYLLKFNCKIIKINYYRFRGFWYDSNFNPYESYKYFKFPYFVNYESTRRYENQGLHNSFKNNINYNIIDIKKKIDNIKINESDFINNFNNEINKLDLLDLKSDVKIKNYFLKNYKDLHLFHDHFHPTNILFYEIFRQVLQILNITIIYNDHDFINSLHEFELTNSSIPILPCIKKILNLNYNDKFYLYSGYKRMYLDIYNYYYIRLSINNFKKYLVNNFIPFYKFKYYLKK